MDFDWKIRGGHYQKQTIQNDNLLILEDTTITTNGITLTIKDGVITINGTSTASTNIDFKIKKKLKAGTYWHFVQRSGNVPSGNVAFLVMKSGGVIATINGSGGDSFTLNEDTEVFYRIWTNKNNIISNVAYKCLINEGSDSKPWVQGIPDSPSIDYASEIETVGSNVNELNIADVEEKEINGVKYSVKNGVLRLDGTATKGIDITLIKNVILKKGIYTHSTNYIQAGMFASFDNENGLNGSNNITKNTFELTEDTTYSRYFVWINKGTVLKNVEQKLKLEKGSVATPYSPYGMGSVEIDVVNKNLLDMKNAKGGKNEGITCTMNKDGSYSYEGTATNGSINVWFLGYWAREDILFSLKPGSYYINGIILYSGKDALNQNNAIVTFKETQNITGVRAISAVAGKTYNEIIYPIIALSDKAVEWVSHQSQTAIMPIQQEMLEGDYVADVEHHEWGKIESYNGENITTNYISTTGELSTGATVYYKLTTPVDLELTSEQKVVREQKLYTYKNITNIDVSDKLASIDVTYKKDLETMFNNIIKQIPSSTSDTTET